MGWNDGMEMWNGMVEWTKIIFKNSDFYIAIYLIQTHSLYAYKYVFHFIYVLPVSSKFPQAVKAF